jgi:hypothetical protein
MGVLKCGGHNGYTCVRGVLFEENMLTGAQVNKGPCPVCVGVVPVTPAKVMQAPGVEDRKAETPEGVRVVHTNLMGHLREPINAKHEEHIRRIRDIALDFYVALHDAGGTDPNQERFANRNLAIASTELETAVMHAVKGICTRR